MNANNTEPPIWEWFIITKYQVSMVILVMTGGRFITVMSTFKPPDRPGGTETVKWKSRLKWRQEFRGTNRWAIWALGRFAGHDGHGLPWQELCSFTSGVIFQYPTIPNPLCILDVPGSKDAVARPVPWNVSPAGDKSQLR